MPRTTRYSIEDLRLAVENSQSFAQVLSKLGLRPAGGNYKYLKERLAKLGINYAHFTHNGWRVGQTFGPKRKLEEYLTEEPRYRIKSVSIKKRLIDEGILEARCSNCLEDSWLGNPIPLELDHVNGVNTDNRLENLRLLCPNCHALTPTYRGKNRGKYLYPPP